jgi:hypothetical protein
VRATSHRIGAAAPWIFPSSRHGRLRQSECFSRAMTWPTARYLDPPHGQTSERNHPRWVMSDVRNPWILVPGHSAHSMSGCRPERSRHHGRTR